MQFQTADLCDAHHEALQVVAPGLQNFGGKTRFFGRIRTVTLDEDNKALIELLQKEGNGDIAVVDAKGVFCAIVGDTLMGYAQKNNWAGIVVNGYVRDIDNTRTIDVGLLALGTCPKKSRKRAEGVRGEPVTFLGVTFKEGAWLYADNDGIIVSPNALF